MLEMRDLSGLSCQLLGAFCASLAAVARVPLALSLLMSLFLKRAAGRKRKLDTPFPSEPELLALAIGLAQYLAKQRE